MTGQAADPRAESEAQRDDRNLMELLQEVRIAGLGVQVLFGFLLAIPFTTRFVRLTTAQRDLYLTALLLAVGLSITASVALVLSYVAPGLAAVLITIVVGLVFTGLWFVLPLLRRDA